MMEKMIFGRYIPGDSFVHKLDPRSKLIFVFLFIAIVFLANNAVTYAVVTGIHFSHGIVITYSLIFLD